VGECERQETQILQQPASRRQGIWGRLSDAQIMHTATMGRTQKQDGEGGIDQEDIFHRVVFFLAALTRRLFRSILGADDAPFGAVTGKRGRPARWPVQRVEWLRMGSPPQRGDHGATSVFETLSRCARAARERVGVSSRVRSAACSAGKRT
jgi:hypothetical protein